jgi:hypothetical protein
MGLVDLLRFAVRAVWSLVGLVLALFVLWFFAEFTWHLAEFLGRTVFAGPW